MLKRIKSIIHIVRWIINVFPSRSTLGYCAPNAQIHYPLSIDTPRMLYLYENSKLRDGVRIINSPKEKVIVKKYTTISSNTTIVTNNHYSTVGIPQTLLDSSHVNDKSTDIIIEEDCWVGTRAILLAGTHLGRGCVVGAGSIVSKEIPPYAIVVGVPSRVVAVKFSIDQILEHEKVLYPETERFTRKYLETLFAEHFNGKKVYGKHSDITEEEHRIVESVKKRIKYVEPILIESEYRV